MRDTEPQTAGGKVLLHFLITLDGFVAGPNHALDWMTGTTVRPGLHDEYIQTTGAILAGRDGWDAAIGDRRPYGGAWEGPIFVLTHHPEDAAPADDERHEPEIPSELTQHRREPPQARVRPTAGVTLVVTNPDERSAGGTDDRAGRLALKHGLIIHARTRRRSRRTRCARPASRRTCCARSST